MQHSLNLAGAKNVVVVDEDLLLKVICDFHGVNPNNYQVDMTKDMGKKTLMCFVELTDIKG